MIVGKTKVSSALRKDRVTGGKVNQASQAEAALIHGLTHGLALVAGRQSSLRGQTQVYVYI